MEFFGLINVVQFFLEYFSFGSSFSSLEERVNYVINTQTISLYVAAGLYVVCLVFGGIGMTVMAKKVGMKHSWLAFLPFANTWYAGKLAGETQLFGRKMKRVGLYAALAEFFFVALSVFGLVLLYAWARTPTAAGCTKRACAGLPKTRCSAAAMRMRRNLPAANERRRRSGFRRKTTKSFTNTTSCGRAHERRPFLRSEGVFR